MAFAARREVNVLSRFLGLNEAPDGDAGIKLGEASTLYNIRVTRERHLQQRPGFHSEVTIGGQIRCLWYGRVAGNDVLLAISEGDLWQISEQPDGTGYMASEIGAVNEESSFIFPFGGYAYILGGGVYYRWDGTALINVITDGSPYIPVVITAADPATGGGTALEGVNDLSDSRRVRYSVPSGGTSTFKLPSAPVSSVDKVTVNGTVTTAYTVNASTGVVTLTAAATQGSNNVEIQYTVIGSSDPSGVLSMLRAETYGGQSDSRIFLYGNGNKLRYSGLTEAGTPSAEYFPSLNVISVDIENEPVTALCRQYNSLVVFKVGSTYVINYDTLADAEGRTVAAFPLLPLNSEIGCSYLGGAVLIENNPFTAHRNTIYEWRGTSVRDERNARKISVRVNESLRKLLSSGNGSELLDSTGAGLLDADGKILGSAGGVLVADYDMLREYWVINGTDAVIYNYESDAWYTYRDMPASASVATDGRVLFIGGADGNIYTHSLARMSDDNKPIDALFEAGSEDYNTFFRKHTIKKWSVVCKPEENSRCHFTVQTDKRADYNEVPLNASLAGFAHVDFSHFSFLTNRRPQKTAFKLKAKKWSFIKLILKGYGDNTSTFTVLEIAADINYSGWAK